MNITHSESVAAIAPALVAAQSEAHTVGMSGTNSYDKYKYSTLVDYLAVLKPVLAQNGLSLICSAPRVLPVDGGRVTKGGSHDNAVFVELEAMILHTSGEWITVSSAGEGQDRADKGTYKAITGARKYLCAMVLNVATCDDPEADETVGVGSAPARPRPAAKPTPPPAGPVESHDPAPGAEDWAAIPGPRADKDAFDGLLDLCEQCKVPGKALLTYLHGHGVANGREIPTSKMADVRGWVQLKGAAKGDA